MFDHISKHWKKKNWETDAEIIFVEPQIYMKRMLNEL